VRFHLHLVSDATGDTVHSVARACLVQFEGAEAIDPGLESLELWYAAGLRSLGPVWSRANAFGFGVPFISPSTPDTGPGLTAAGRELVKRCAELGILVDVSHLNEAGFWDLARLELGPIVASHAAASAYPPRARPNTGKTDFLPGELRRRHGATRVVARPLEITGLLELFDTYPMLAHALVALEPSPSRCPCRINVSAS